MRSPDQGILNRLEHNLHRATQFANQLQPEARVDFLLRVRETIQEQEAMMTR